MKIDFSKWRKTQGDWLDKLYPPRKPEPPVDWEAARRLYEVQQDLHRRHLENLKKAATLRAQLEALGKSDLPLDDLLDNLDEVREFLKHIKSLKQ